MKTAQERRVQLQKLLDQAMKLQGTIVEIDSEIEKFQNSLLGAGWSEGNLKVGWAKGDCFAEAISTILMNRDRIFSLSSATSRASTHLSAVQNQKTAPCDGARFYKKKKKHIKKKSESEGKKGKERVARSKERYTKRNSL